VIDVALTIWPGLCSLRNTPLGVASCMVCR
jgi:hypothetical protein